MGEPRTVIGGPGAAHRWQVPGGLLLVLAVLTVSVLAGGPLIALDRWIRAAVLDHSAAGAGRWLAGDPSSPARLLIDAAGFKIAISSLVFVALVLAVRRRSLRPLLAAAAGVALLLGIVLPAKILIARVHPGHAVLVPGTLGAFPSGHTSTASVCYGLALLLITPDPGGPGRRTMVAAACAVGFAVGAALIWTDFHWFTDVAAGWALAGLIVPLALRLNRGRTRRYPPAVSTTLPHLPPALKKP